jgi:hypothetical protein
MLVENLRSDLRFEPPLTALALIIGPTPDGWAVYRTDGRKLARYHGIGAKRRALRFLRRFSR